MTKKKLLKKCFFIIIATVCSKPLAFSIFEIILHLAWNCCIGGWGEVVLVTVVLFISSLITFEIGLWCGLINMRSKSIKMSLFLSFMTYLLIYVSFLLSYKYFICICSWALWLLYYELIYIYNLFTYKVYGNVFLK